MRSWRIESFARNSNSIVNFRKLYIFELDVHHRPDDLNDPSDSFSFFSLCLWFGFLLFFVIFFCHVYFSRLSFGQGLDGGHDLQEFLGDRSLPDFIQNQSEVSYQILVVSSRVIHGHHPGRLFGR